MFSPPSSSLAASCLPASPGLLSPSPFQKICLPKKTPGRGCHVQYLRYQCGCSIPPSLRCLFSGNDVVVAYRACFLVILSPISVFPTVAHPKLLSLRDRAGETPTWYFPISRVPSGGSPYPSPPSFFKSITPLDDLLALVSRFSHCPCFGR